MHDRVGGADPNAVGIVAQQHEGGGGVLEVGGNCGLPQPHVLRNTGHSLQQRKGGIFLFSLISSTQCLNESRPGKNSLFYGSTPAIFGPSAQKTLSKSLLNNGRDPWAHTHAHTRTHSHTHTYTHAHPHARTPTNCSSSITISCKHLKKKRITAVTLNSGQGHSDYDKHSPCYHQGLKDIASKTLRI